MSGVIKQFPLEEEFKKTMGITSDDIRLLREWLDSQPHLPGDHITDLDLVLAYHCCDRSMEVAKQLIDLHYTMKTIFTNLFSNRTVDSSIENVLKIFVPKPLPVRTKEGYAILYSQFINSDPQTFNFSDTIRTILMTLDLWQYEEGTWPGLVIVSNFGSTSLGHVTKFEMTTFQQYSHFMQEALLLKLKAIHILNAPSFIDRLLGMARPFLKKSLFPIIHVHQAGSKEIGKYIPLEALPKEAGGDYKSLLECQEETVERFRANKEFFVNEGKKRVVEAKRPGKPKTITDFFGGVEGSFKKLEID